jgi:hypothetical protein
MLAPTLPDLSQLDREALQALLLAEHQERIATHQREDCPIPAVSNSRGEAIALQAQHGSTLA